MQEMMVYQTNTFHNQRDNTCLGHTSMNINFVDTSTMKWHLQYNKTAQSTSSTSRTMHNEGKLVQTKH